MTADREDPRVARSRRTVLEAAVAVLADLGYGGFTIDAVARRSGVARSTIYRHWSDRAELIDAALSSLNVQPVPGPRTLDDPDAARRAVLDLLRHLDAGVNDGPVAACLPALVDGAERDPAIRRLHHQQSERRRRTLTGLVRHACTGPAGGETGEEDADLVAQALAGAVIYARLMTPHRFTTDQLERLVDLLLPTAEGRG